MKINATVTYILASDIFGVKFKYCRRIGRKTVNPSLLIFIQYWQNVSTLSYGWNCKSVLTVFAKLYYNGDKQNP